MGPATAVVTVVVMANTRCVFVAPFLVSELTEEFMDAAKNPGPS